MSSLSDNRGMSDPVEAIEDYLDRLIAPLVEMVPRRERQAFREEAHDHLRALTEEFIELGMHDLEAAERAIQEFGPPLHVARTFLRGRPGRLEATSSTALHGGNRLAFGFFGGASALYLALVERYLFVPYQAGLLPWLIGLSFCLPFLAGGLVGKTAAISRLRTLLTVIAVTSLPSLWLGKFCLGSAQSGIAIFPLALMGIWLPVGTLGWSVGKRYASPSPLGCLRRQLAR